MDLGGIFGALTGVGSFASLVILRHIDARTAAKAKAAEAEIEAEAKAVAAKAAAEAQVIEHYRTNSAAEITARHEAVTARIVGTPAVVEAATAWGVAVAAQHRECEENRRKDAIECARQIEAIAEEYRADREYYADRVAALERNAGTTPPPKRADPRREP